MSIAIFCIFAGFFYVFVSLACAPPAASPGRRRVRAGLAPRRQTCPHSPLGGSVRGSQIDAIGAPELPSLSSWGSVRGSQIDAIGAPDLPSPPLGGGVRGSQIDAIGAPDLLS